MSDWLTWMKQHEALATWLSGIVTAGALVWALYVARADARRANSRATANLLAADDALGALQQYLEDLTRGRTGFDDVFDSTESWLKLAPFDRFRDEMREVDMSSLPSQWSRRALRRARAIVEETSLDVSLAVDPMRSKSVSSAALAEVAADLRRCRQALSPDFTGGTPWAWLQRLRTRGQRPRPTRLGTLE